MSHSPCRPVLPTARPWRAAAAGLLAWVCQASVLAAPAAPVTAPAALPATVPAAATAAESGSGLPLAALGQSIEQLARDSVPGQSGEQPRIEVEIGSLDPRLKLAPCERIEPYLPPGLPAWGRTRIGLKCTQGAKAWNVTLPITVHAFRQAQVLTAALPAGTVLEASHLMSAEVDLAAAAGAAVLDARSVLGRSLARPLAAGATLRQPDLKARQWFAAGDTVKVVAVGPGWSIATEGQAMSPGIEGQTIRVRTENGRLIQGRPVADRQVEVGL